MEGMKMWYAAVIKDHGPIKIFGCNSEKDAREYVRRNFGESVAERTLEIKQISDAEARGKSIRVPGEQKRKQ